jgi:hypothetical protein
MEPTVANMGAIVAAGKHIIAWQGVRIITPTDWEPGALSGDWAGGHIRIDERLEPRLVIRWLPDESTRKLFAKAESREAAVRQVVANYLRELERNYKKKKQEVRHESLERLLPRRKLDISPIEYFAWTIEDPPLCGVGLGGECTRSGRVMLCELTGLDQRETRDRAAELLATLRPFPESDDSVLWSFFGLRFALDRAWTLSGSSLLGGKVEVRFSREGGAQLAVQRWIANVALGKGDLVDWAKNQLAKDLKGDFSFRMEKGRCRGHDAVLADGTKRSPRERVAHSAKRVFRVETPFFLECRAWHCEPENKIYVVRAVCKESEKGFADEATARFYCHVAP